ncbi:hypothetical protein RSOLAG1IB_12133 [Rhizoctonia solani AG-1 IB]|uniref:Uncharacterized protein n=1 Tax=Thanatephorus cucumeris (strain AG1-IB / isolate 7/3/14) TaxID=1108050 RepID=A0A0B7FNG1_THACB|nr:hypothetical protein RSOLAG1IB_12133 [Rhizoctonia solani AG-1 IB]
MHPTNRDRAKEKAKESRRPRFRRRAHVDARNETSGINDGGSCRRTPEPVPTRRQAQGSSTRFKSASRYRPYPRQSTPLPEARPPYFPPDVIVISSDSEPELEARSKPVKTAASPKPRPSPEPARELSPQCIPETPPEPARELSPDFIPETPPKTPVEPTSEPAPKLPREHTPECSNTATDEAAACARYTARWEKMEKSLKPGGYTIEALLSFSEIPWPMLRTPSGPSEITREAVHEFVLLSHNQEQTARARWHAFLRRWHPDKFRRWTNIIVPADHARVTQGVTAVAAIANALLADESV